MALLAFDFEPLVYYVLHHQRACVCVCARVHVYVCVSMRACVCACACVHARTLAHECSCLEAPTDTILVKASYFICLLSSKKQTQYTAGVQDLFILNGRVEKLPSWLNKDLG